MILPRTPRDRHEAIVKIGRRCAVSRMDRKAYYRELREWYVRGSITQDRARYNKLKAHVRQSSAFLYQSESTRFGLVVPTRYGDQFMNELETARDDFHRAWHDSRAGATVGIGVKWAHVYATSILKVVPCDGQAVVSLVPDPSDVGVLEEDRPFDRQEAIIHFYQVTMAQFRRMIRGHRDEAALMTEALSEADLGTGDEAMEPAIERVVLNTVSPTMDGALTSGPSRLGTTARIEAPRVTCCEVWVVDSEIQDWRVVTCLAPAGEVARVVWDRRTPVLSGTDPFVALTLEEGPDYVWGFSEVDDLSGLQEWRDRRMDQVDRLMELQLDPPIVLGGFGGLSDERAARLRKPGGTLSSSMPNPSVNRLAPTMPPEAFGEVNEIDKMFADQAGLPILFSGQGDPGIRAGNQLGVLATLSSARLRENAMRVEYATSEVATLLWRLRRELHDEPLTLPNGSRFLLTQLPRDTVALVAAHSSSPLYAAAIKADADALLRAGAIDLPTYVELKDPPMVDVLRARARRLAEAKAKQADRILSIKEQAALRGRTR